MQRSAAMPHVEIQSQKFTVNWLNMFRLEEAKTHIAQDVTPALSSPKVQESFGLDN